MVTPVLMILKASDCDATVVMTSEVVMGRDTGPLPRTGWPQASSCVGSI